MSLLKQLQLKWSKGTATVATIATVDLLQKPSVAKVATVASSHAGGSAKPKPLTGFDPSDDSAPLLEILLDLGNQICDFWNDSEVARAAMRDDIVSYPPNKREALAEALKSSLMTQHWPTKVLVVKI